MMWTGDHPIRWRLQTQTGEWSCGRGSDVRAKSPARRARAGGRGRAHREKGVNMLMGERVYVLCTYMGEQYVSILMPGRVHTRR